MRFRMLSLALAALVLGHVGKAAEWNCASTSGTFDRSTDCTMSAEVAVSGDLTVTGKETVYSTLTAASGKRHFKITSGTHRVSLSWLNMTGGNVGTCNSCEGGSIHVKNVAAQLNISHCVFFNNRAGRGGAIYARDGPATVFISDFSSFNQNHANYGGAVYLRNAKLVDHSSMYNMNTAGYSGGALCLFSGSFSFYNSSLVSNTAGWRGGGIYIFGSSSSSSFLNLSSVTLQSNKQTGGGTYPYDGGGGLMLWEKVTANIRECTFIRNEATAGSTGNKHGHQVFTLNNIPFFAIVNTNFTDVSGSHPFYGKGGANNYESPTTCASSNPCSVTPFTGSCSAQGNTKQGVLCSITCPAGSYKLPTAILPPSVTCADKCPGGKYGNVVGQTGESAACPSQCPRGKYGADTGKTNEAGACPSSCPGGKYGDVTGQTSEGYACEECPLGKYGDVSAAGSLGAGCPNPCPGGKYGDVTGQTSEGDACEDCPGGKYGDVSAAGSLGAGCPSSCPGGKYGSGTGETTEAGACPSTCTGGKYGNVVGQTSEGDACPSLCPLGKYGNVLGQTNEANACMVCMKGKYSDQPGRTGCDNCPSGKHIVDDGFTASKHDAESDCVAAEIISIQPNNQSTLGGTFTTFIGKKFGATSSSGSLPIDILVNGNEWTDVTYVNDTCITAVSPAGAGFNLPIEIKVDGITYNSIPELFSYRRPNISHITPPPFKGGTVQIYGTDFGQRDDIDTIVVFDANGCNQDCTGPEIIDNGLQCQYGQIGTAGAHRTIAVTVAGQISNVAQYTYDIDKGEISGVPAGVRSVAETQDLGYSISLSIPPAEMNTPAAMVIHIEASSLNPDFNCTATPPNITLHAADDGTPQPVVIKTSGNVIDEGTGEKAFTCEVVHTLGETNNEQYQDCPERIVTINVMNDDEANVHMWTISDVDGSYEYDIKFLSFFNPEGESFQYGVRLDTEPRSPVRIEPIISLRNSGDILSPPVLSVEPKHIVFGASNWSVHQRFVFNSTSDDVDNDLQVFEIVHNVLTDDEVFLEKSTLREMKVLVTAADDDTAKVSVESKTIAVKEGGDPKTIVINGLSSKPAYDVHVLIETPDDLIVASPNRAVIKKEKWNNFSQTIQLTASNGAPTLDQQDGAVLRFKPMSLDPKYNNTAMELSRDMTVEPATPFDLLGIPPLATVNEGDPFSYEIKLSTTPKQNVKVVISSSGTCNVDETFNVGDKAQPMTIPIKARTVATAKASVLGSCTVVHRVYSSDPNYADIEAKTLAIDIISTGCGIGEYRGPYNRSNGTECICGPRYYKPPAEDCLLCPEKGLVCDDAGIEIPAVAEDYWRHDPTSPDFGEYPLYECIIPDSCVGGSSTKGRCAKGYDDSAPICAVCAKDYVFQQGLCTPCEGYIGGGITSPSPQMLVAGIVCLALSMVATYFYFTLPALSTEEEDVVRAKLSKLDIEDMFEYGEELNIRVFSSLVDSLLTDGEILHVFHAIDTGNSASITKEELVAYIKNAGQGGTNDDGEKVKDSSERKKRGLSMLGTTVMKLKILLTFIQCMSFLPIVFDLSFPNMMTKLMKYLELSSLDIYVFFGEVSCHMQTTFEQKFIFHMLLIPVLCVCICLVWCIAILRLKLLSAYTKPKFTKESMETSLYNLISLLAFGLYPGLSSKIFRVFKCREVQGRFYLVADYSIECYAGKWWTFALIAVLCILFYIVGIPMGQFYPLWKNRKNLHETSALDPQTHRLVKKQFGSLYQDYTDECYYFEIVNMIRRLILTGGLILVGQESVVQALLGILTSVLWLLLVTGKLPYNAYWDNMLEISLSFGILMSLISGFALELYNLKSADGYEHVTFDFLLVAMIILCILAGVFALIISLPACRAHIVKYAMKGHVETKRHYLHGWVKDTLPIVKYLSNEEMRRVMRSCQKRLNKRSGARFERSQKEKRLSKIFPKELYDEDDEVLENHFAAVHQFVESTRTTRPARPVRPVVTGSNRRFRRAVLRVQESKGLLSA